MRLHLCKLCEYAFKLENGRHSMIGIFDDVRVPHLPIDHPGFYACIQLEFEQTEASDPLNLEWALVDPDGLALIKATMNTVVPEAPEGGPIRMFVQAALPAIRFEKHGDHRLDLLLNGQRIGEERFPVFVVQASS